MKRQNHDAHVYAPWKYDSASLPFGARVVASEPGTQSRCANASRCWSSEYAWMITISFCSSSMPPSSRS